MAALTKEAPSGALEPLASKNGSSEARSNVVPLLPQTERTPDLSVRPNRYGEVRLSRWATDQDYFNVLFRDDPDVRRASIERSRRTPARIIYLLGPKK